MAGPGWQLLDTISQVLSAFNYETCHIFSGVLVVLISACRPLYCVLRIGGDMTYEYVLYYNM
jgi:hypothetical protein